MAQAAAGSREAFDDLVRLYRRRVYNFVRTLTGGDNESEDLVQEIFVRAYRGLGAFRGDSAFRSWLYRIALNAVHTHLTRRRARDAVVVSGHDIYAIDAVAANDDHEQALLRRQAIDRALSSLPEELRVLVVLRDVHGLRYGEIREIVDLPLGTVESRLFRARRRLRPLLEGLAAEAPHALAVTVPTRARSALVATTRHEM